MSRVPDQKHYTPWANHDHILTVAASARLPALHVLSGTGARRGDAPRERDRPHVRIAEYLYRHEAEFAAGFLRDAGIPFRLQIDDAGGADAGVTIARPAVIWVRADDEDEARVILGLEDDDSAAVERVPSPDGITARRRPDSRDAARSARARHTSRAPGVGFSRTPTFEPLCGTERIVAGLLALALVGLASYGGEGAVPWVGVWETVALLLGLVLGLSAVSGKTLASIRAILRALSGTAP